jgi:transposase
MYFHKKTSASGETLQLLESFRNSEGQPRHKIVMSLGNADIKKEFWEEIAQGIESALNGQHEFNFIKYSTYSAKWIEKIIKRIEREGRAVGSVKINDTGNIDVIDGVLIDKVEHTHTTPLGSSLLGKHAWDTLGIPEFLKELGFNEAQRETAAVSIISRLTDPGTENSLVENLENTSFPDLFGEEIIKGGKDRFYRVSDKLMEYKAEIEKHLREKQKTHFGFKRNILLYDLTNTHFEGVCSENPKALHGHNKQMRDDCCQVVIGMVFDENGIELAHETFAGNMNDGKSLKQMLTRLKEVTEDTDLNAGLEKSLVVIDAGIANKKNLELLREAGFNYLVNDSRRGRSHYADEFGGDNFTKIKCRSHGLHVEIKVLDEIAEGAELKERVILCRSEKRGEKEKAMVNKTEARFLKALEELALRINEGKLKKREKIERCIGKLTGKNTRIARFYKVEALLKADGTGYELKYSRHDEKYKEMEGLFGCYILRTDRIDLEGEQLWQIYTSLAYAEAGFRALKSELGLRPNHHRLEIRADAHIFITVIAYHLQQFILNTLRNTGDYRSWPTLRRILDTHCYTTILCPTKDGVVYRLRKPGLPEECQLEIYNHFDINLKKFPFIKIAL